jgi:hypothetical protein
VVDRLRAPAAGMRRRGAIAVVVIGAALGPVAIAWACTPSADIVVSPSQGRPGDSATVSGAQFRDGLVSLHWDSTGGPVIGSGTGPSFSTTVTTPAASPGGHYIVAIQDGGGTDTAPYAVLADQPASSPSTPGTGSTSSPSAGAGTQPAHPTGGSHSGGGGRSSGRGSVPGSAAAAVPAALPAPPASSESSRAGKASQESGSASEQSAVADLWSAFGKPRESALSGLGGPAASTGGGDNSFVSAGMVVLAVGLLALLAGLGIAAAQRRRATIN